MEERRKAEKCQKYGKLDHMWFDCYSKALTTTRADVDTKRGTDSSSSNGRPKKAKTMGSGIKDDR